MLSLYFITFQKQGSAGLGFRPVGRSAIRNAGAGLLNFVLARRAIKLKHQENYLQICAVYFAVKT